MAGRITAEDDAMRRDVTWVAGLVLVVAVVLAVTLTVGTRGATRAASEPAPQAEKPAPPAPPAEKTAAAKVNLTAPFPKAEAAAAPARPAPRWTGNAKATPANLDLAAPFPKSGDAPAAPGATFKGFAKAPAAPGAAPLTAAQEFELLAEARALVTQMEANGKLTFERDESIRLTMLVYESLRRQRGRGTPPAPVPAATP